MKRIQTRKVQRSLRSLSIFYGIICFFLQMGSLSVAEESSRTFGSYSGVLTVDRLQRDQLARLELIPERTSSGNIDLQAILTLQFGGFDSTEYISYHYHDVQFNIFTGQLNFNQVDQEVQITGAKFKDGELTGEVISTSGRVGVLRLSHSTNKVIAKNSLIEPLNGEYKGYCGRDPSLLQLFTYRTINDNSRLGNPFGAYEVKGQMGQSSSVYCVGTHGKFCVQSKIKAASYDFFNGRLFLNGSPESYECTVIGNTIQCNDCRFQRISNEMKGIKTQRPLLKNDPFEFLSLNTIQNPQELSSTGDATDLVTKESRASDFSKLLSENSFAGEYSGFVYHENLKKYQKVQLKLSTFQSLESGSPKLMISAVAQLEFNPSDSEKLIYKFDPVEFPNPLLPRKFLLLRPEADVDALIEVTEVKDGVIKGNWYSIIFGKVGPFVVTKGQPQTFNINSLPLLNEVSGFYEEWGKPPYRDLNLELFVTRERAPLNSDNPFFPLNIRGRIGRKSGLNSSESITQSSYDFYTGKMTLLYGDERLLSGELNPESRLSFRRLAGAFGTIMQPFSLTPYKQTKRNSYVH